MKIDDQTTDYALIMMKLISQSEDDFRKGRSYTSTEVRAEVRDVDWEEGRRAWWATKD